MEKRHRIFSTA